MSSPLVLFVGLSSKHKEKIRQRLKLYTERKIPDNVLRRKPKRGSVEGHADRVRSLQRLTPSRKA